MDCGGMRVVIKAVFRSQRSGVACTAVLIRAREESGTTLVMSSDAAKDDTSTPGVGGHMHGCSWYLPLLPCDVVGPLRLPINGLELRAIYMATS